MKPVELVARAFFNSSNEGDVVLDLFGGSGTTILAAAQTERLCCSMELDPKYVDVIVKRYIQNAGSDAGVFLVRDGETVAHQDLD
jgi:DNA modification methylase